MSQNRDNARNSGSIDKPPNTIFPPHGIVKGSLENVEKEELFLCDRLLYETSIKRHDFVQTKWISYNNAVPSVIQGMKRPVCGLVALCMAGHMLQKHNPATSTYDYDERILEIARKLGFSKQGEMFSAKHYADLAECVLNCNARVITTTLSKSWKEIFNHICMGYPALVPYDTDRNYEPCLKKGHKAHWALLTGFIIGQKKRYWKSADKNFPILKMNDHNQLMGIFNEMGSQNNDTSLFFVYAKQGKSARQQLWSLKSLSDSNANLMEVNPDRDRSMYQIPREGIDIALCSKIVLLFPNHVPP